MSLSALCKKALDATHPSYRLDVFCLLTVTRFSERLEAGGEEEAGSSPGSKTAERDDETAGNSMNLHVGQTQIIWRGMHGALLGCAVSLI